MGSVSRSGEMALVAQVLMEVSGFEDFGCIFKCFD